MQTPLTDVKVLPSTQGDDHRAIAKGGTRKHKEKKRKPPVLLQCIEVQNKRDQAKKILLHLAKIGNCVNRRPRGLVAPVVIVRQPIKHITSLVHTPTSR